MAKAKEELEQEMLDKEEDKQRYLTERAPPLQTQGMSFAELQVTSCLNETQLLAFSLAHLVPHKNPYGLKI